MDDPRRLYECLLDYCSSTQVIERISIGSVWTVCQSSHKNLTTGLAMTPSQPVRTLTWPGTLQGRSLQNVARWILEWEPYQATVAMAAINCSINSHTSVPNGALLDAKPGSANLTVFEHFLPLTEHQKVVVIGHYPGLEKYREKYGWTILERMPQAGDLPDPACEFLLPEADWVFLSASTIPNKTFPRLAALAASANTVLMGPTVPWITELKDFGIDYLAGVEVVDAQALYQTAQEGGGVRIFESGVRYKVVPLTEEMNSAWLKHQIAETFAQKERLTQAMEQWYEKGGLKRFPGYAELQDTNVRLSRLDSAFKKLWDAQHSTQQQ